MILYVRILQAECKLPSLRFTVNTKNALNFDLFKSGQPHESTTALAATTSFVGRVRFVELFIVSLIKTYAVITDYKTDNIYMLPIRTGCGLGEKSALFADDLNLNSPSWLVDIFNRVY